MCPFLYVPPYSPTRNLMSPTSHVTNTTLPTRIGLSGKMRKVSCTSVTASACWHPTAWNGNSFKHIVRAIAVESHHTIYSGGSEDLGRWDRDQSGELKYTSLKGLINGDNPLDNQSFWRIWIEGDKVYFQSFSHIYVYDHHTITPVDGPNAFLLLLKVRNEYWVQEMYGALYQLHNGILNKISTINRTLSLGTSPSRDN